MDRFQSLERFQVEVLVTYHQVAALNQSQAEVAGQVGVLKIGFVVGPRCEQGNMGVFTGRTGLLDVVHQRTVCARQALHGHTFKSLGKEARHSQPVFHQVT